MFWSYKRRRLLKLLANLKSVIVKEKFSLMLERLQFNKSKAFLFFNMKKILTKQEASDFEDEVKNLSKIAGYKEENISIAVSSPPIPKKEDVLKNVKNIVCVASCKGGVGKSTIAINLALDYAVQGFKVGLLDADIYGPSIPLMLELSNAKPEFEDGKIIPIIYNDIKVASMGFLVKEEEALLWRGAMATKTIKSLFEGVKWGELDLLVVDLPPGTGDIYLSLLASYKITGAMLVSSSHIVSSMELKKTITMFKKFNVNILGVVENMIENEKSEIESEFKAKREAFKKEGFFRMNLNFPSKLKIL